MKNQSTYSPAAGCTGAAAHESLKRTSDLYRAPHTERRQSQPRAGALPLYSHSAARAIAEGVPRHEDRQRHRNLPGTVI